MHCRYCFRQNFPYETKTHSFDNEIAYLERHSSIQEVILSGGDPLSLPDETLKNLFDALAAIDHIKIVRFHSRFLMGVPERIDESFIRLLKQFPKQIVFVLHANHPNEFDDDVWSAIKQIQLCGIPTLNQSVLLRGVNDSASIQEALSMQLISHGVIPYYLHQLDPVQGASHFEVAIEQGRAIIDELRSRLPGYAVPKYVAEIPGKPSKTAL
jgi:KamA family protein